MRRASLFSVLSAGFALLLCVSALGCGGGNDARSLTPQLLDQISLAGSCADTCTTMAACAPWMNDAAVDEHMDVCQQHCNAPVEADEELRDCSLACDLELDCVDYFACLCACGMEGVCF